MGVGAAIAGSAVVGAVSSSSAAGKQADAANNAADATTAASAQMRTDLQPYTNAGTSAINPLWAAMGYTQDANGNMVVNPNSTLQQQFSFNPSDLASTPGYQFTLQQGLRGVNNQLASQGLGLSGAQLKGATTYATGLADNTYNQQYNNALSTYNTNYQTASNNVSNLQSLVNTGQNSAAQTGQAGISAANSAGNYLTQAGNADAAGTIATSNNLNNGLNNYLTYNKLYKT